MSKELSPLVIYQIFKGKYHAKYEFSIGETLTYDAECIYLYIVYYVVYYCIAIIQRWRAKPPMAYPWRINSPWRILVGPFSY